MAFKEEGSIEYITVDGKKVPVVKINFLQLISFPDSVINPFTLFLINLNPITVSEKTLKLQ